MDNFRVSKLRGVVFGVIRTNADGTETHFAKDSREWLEFVEANAKSESPVDLEDKPEPPPRDTERESIAAILEKSDADITAGEFKAVMLKLARRLAVKGQL